MKIIYKYKGDTKKGEINVKSFDNDLPSPSPSENIYKPPFILLGEDKGTFLEFCAIFGIIAPYPDDIIVGPPTMETFSLMSISSNIQNNSLDVAPEYIELVTLCGFDSMGFFSMRVPNIEFEPPVVITPSLARATTLEVLDTRNSTEINSIEDLELIYQDARPFLQVIDPRIKLQDIVVTPIKNIITVLPNLSNPTDEDNIYSHLEDYNVSCCSTLRVEKPPGFGCTPTDLMFTLAREEEVAMAARMSVSEIQPINIEPVLQVPDYSFGVTARYKINDGPWITYQRLSSEEETPVDDYEYELQSYFDTDWYGHVNNFFRSIKDLEGRRIFSFRGGGAEYVPFEISMPRWNNNYGDIYGAELDFRYIDEEYYPPPIDWNENSEIPTTQPVDINRQTTVYFQVTQDSGRLADIIDTIFGKDEEVRSCCYTTWPGY